MDINQKSSADHIIEHLNAIEIDGETMEYIINGVNINYQMSRQLIMKSSDLDAMGKSAGIWSAKETTYIKKESRGGIRKNAGAKPKYNEPTKTIAFRCPVSKVDELKSVVKNQLEKWKLKNELPS